MQYYIASLNCNLILKEDIKKDKEKMIEELSEKSRLLLEKGPTHQNDIGWLTSYIADYYNFPGFGVTYNFITYSPFSHFKGNGFDFKRLIGPKKFDTLTVSLFDNDKKIKTTFIHNFKDVNYYANITYRDRNNLFMKDFLTGK